MHFRLAWDGFAMVNIMRQLDIWPNIILDVSV
jgi:hypothetical protein